MTPNVTTEFRDFYTQIGIEVGRTCNARCEHCITFSGPKNHSKMDPDVMVRVIQDAAELGLPHVELTGGEPFLFRHELEHILELGHQLGLTTGSTTNCFWAAKMPDAVNLLKRLQSLGLIRLRLSLDQYHLNYIPLQRVQTAIQACLTAGVECFVEATIGRKDYRMYDAIRELKKLAVSVRVSELLPFGKAADFPSETFLHHSFFEVTHSPCLTAATPVVESDGRVLLCCSYPVAQDSNDLASPFVLGDARNESLITILSRHLHNPLLRILRYEGPGGLFRLLQAKRGKEACQERSVYSGGICTLCADVMNSSAFRELWHATVAQHDDTQSVLPSELIDKARARNLVTITPAAGCQSCQSHV
jgi:Radical SAM superfamily